MKDEGQRCRAKAQSKKKPDHTHTCDGHHGAGEHDHFCPGCREWWYRRPGAVRTIKSTKDVSAYKADKE